MKPAALLTLCLALLLTSAVHAQDVRWPPDHTALFAPGVEVVEAEHIIFSEYGTQPDVELDESARIVTVYTQDMMDFQQFPYPDRVATLQGSFREGEYLYFNAVERDENPDLPPMRTLWQLDPNTGSFERYETSCIDWETDGRTVGTIGGTSILEGWSNGWGSNAILNAARWVFYHHLPDGRTTLCHTETGEMRGLLPKDIPYWVYTLESPTGEWVVALGSKYTYGRLLEAYAVNVSTGNVHYLGEIAEMDDFSFDRWYSDTVFVLYSGGMPESAGKLYYIVDIAQPKSILTMNGRATYNHYLQRYEYVITYGKLLRYGTFPTHVNCRLELFDLPTMRQSTHELGYNCGGIAVLDDGRYVYLRYEQDPSQPATLLSLDPATDQREVLLSGEYEVLDSVSPDGRYAVLIQDDNGQLDRAQLDDPQFFSELDMRNPRLITIDLQTGLTVNERTLTSCRSGSTLYEDVSYRGMSRSENGRFLWLNDNMVLCRPPQENGRVETLGYPYRVFQFNSTGVVETDFENVEILPLYTFLPQGEVNWLLLWDEDTEGLVRLARRNLTTGEIQEITQFLNPNQFTFNVYSDESGDERLLRFAVRSVSEIPVRQATYTLRIPE
jgi:hypothetical protein